MSPWTILAGVLLLGGAFAGGYYEGHKQEANVLAAQVETLKAADATALAASEAKARGQEQADAQHLAVITQTHQQDLANAKANYDANVAALRSGDLKLRKEWTCTPTLAASVSSAASGGLVPDAATLQRQKDASDIVRIGADADAEITALQAVIRADRQQLDQASSSAAATQ
jgi:hypothetical protein